MSKKRKNFDSTRPGAPACLCAGFAVVAYYMNSPGQSQALVEQCISAATGTKCSVSEFSYSLNPISVHARGIRLADHTRLFLLGNSRLGDRAFLPRLLHSKKALS